ncbi:alpha/beta fold hydrolase [Nitratireductor aquimarinus]|uniref:alpha/beta fold hydrolase n=1 Tax=Nitratireductor TaxID=245876 RepID=UPI0019D38244|nr:MULTISPECIES: alpha/beta hydrolase [Nitratireductor]MBN7776249.1 alpha/beta fold hydrolase [Nitratireductor pacificus]MBN7779116.1 alpha/beta fold hydrolase [Nitratireductor pacificus]MBN7787923.1 alpha/beta fold hydrolase [Nitratireductor aquimarinus]MBY6097970.1 alpha/beta hydrolase [Nitratireductor aquimarinus]MCA1259842.1 alpha/beta hydrolase [Nitratireductor aquimarinus]
MSEFGIAEINGGAIRYRLTGEGAPLLLVSGLGGTAGFWDPFCDALQGPWRILRFDQRGCGQSPPPKGAVCVYKLAGDALAVAAHVFGAQPFHAMGHSTGGAIVQAMSLRAPSLLRACVLSGTWIRADAYMHALFALRQDILRKAPELYAPLTALSARAPRADDDPHLWQKAVAGRENAPDASFVAVMQERIAALLAFDGTAAVAALEAPALVLGARDDGIVPSYHQQALHEALTGAALHMFDDGGHFFPATRAADTAAVVGDWLSRQAAANGSHDKE